MKQYLELLKDIVDNGVDVPDRTGVGRRKVFGRMLRYNLKEGFPVVTTREVNWKAAIVEILWMLKGNNDITDLHANNVRIWDKWVLTEENKKELFEHRQNTGITEKHKDEIFKVLKNRIGYLYGVSWRTTTTTSVNRVEKLINFDQQELATDHFLQLMEEVKNKEVFNYYDNIVKTIFEEQVFFLESDFHYSYEEPQVLVKLVGLLTNIDQMQDLVQGLKNNPYSSRHIVSAWTTERIASDLLTIQENIALGFGGLAPCHILQQYIVLPPLEEGGKMRLSLMMTQRSMDAPLGQVFNTVGYCALLMMVAQCVDMEPFEFIHSVGDAHIYLDQIDSVKEQLKREPLPLPQLKINTDNKDLFNFKIDDFELVDYNYKGKIKYNVAVGDNKLVYKYSNMNNSVFANNASESIMQNNNNVLDLSNVMDNVLPVIGASMSAFGFANNDQANDNVLAESDGSVITTENNDVFSTTNNDPSIQNSREIWMDEEEGWDGISNSKQESIPEKLDERISETDNSTYLSDSSTSTNDCNSDSDSCSSDSSGD